MNTTLTQDRTDVVQQPLHNKIAVVTGAGSGIGRAAAVKLAEQGARVLLLDLRNERSEQLLQELTSTGAEALFIDTDIANPSRVQEAYKQAVSQWEKVDIVFANAGINGTVTPIEDLTPEEWDQTLSTNLKGTFLTVKCAIPYMKKQGGSIIITSSINGNRTFSSFGMSAYSTSKAGQATFAKMAALELARYKIRVNVICPGAIETNINQSTHKTPQLDKIKIPINYPEGSQPLQHGPGQPEQVAELVYFLASGASNHITGTEIYIDGAESLL